MARRLVCHVEAITFRPNFNNMKRLVLSLIASVIFITLNSQISEAVIFSEFGEKFTAYLNGTAQNQEPMNSIEIGNLKSEFFQLRIDFEDPTIADFQMNNFVVHPGMTCVYMVKLNRKGKYVCRFQSESSFIDSDESSLPNSETSKLEVVQSLLEQESARDVKQTETKTSIQPSSDNISMDFKAPGVDVSFKLNTNETETTEEMEVFETSSQGTASQTIAKEEHDGINCNSLVGKTEMDQMISSIDSKSFSDSKLIVAKQAIKGNCLKASQVKTLMMLFDFEDDRLELAKYAYDFTLDKQNYYMVNDAFTFEMTIEELNAYIQSK
jgi:hypothetical protein